MSTKDQIKASIYGKIKLTAIGNSNRKMKDVAADCLFERVAKGEAINDIADECYLSTKTLVNLMDGKTMNPQSETLERIFRACSMEMSLEHGVIKSKFTNKPKE